jgi:hypothetical protein
MRRTRTKSNFPPKSFSFGTYEPKFQDEAMLYRFKHKLPLYVPKPPEPHWPSGYARAQRVIFLDKNPDSVVNGPPSFHGFSAPPSSNDLVDLSGFSVVNHTRTPEYGDLVDLSGFDTNQGVSNNLPEEAAVNDPSISNNMGLSNYWQNFSNNEPLIPEIPQFELNEPMSGADTENYYDIDDPDWGDWENWGNGGSAKSFFKNVRKGIKNTKALSTLALLTGNPHVALAIGALGYGSHKEVEHGGRRRRTTIQRRRRF